MYEIRFYRTKVDDNNNEYVTYDKYGIYESYESAWKEMKWLIEFYQGIKVDDVVFSSSFPENKIEDYVLFLSKKGKELATIVNV